MQATTLKPELLIETSVSKTWNGNENTSYSTMVSGAKLTAGSIERLCEMAANYQPVTNDGAANTYDGKTFNND